MRTYLIIVLLFGTSMAMAQQKAATYRAWVKGDIERYGFDTKLSLSQIKDSSLVLTSLSGEGLNANSIEIPYSSINKLQFRQRKSTWRRVLLGSIIGGATGFLVGFSQGDDRCSSNSFCILNFSALDKGIIFGVPGTVLGAAAGAISSTIKFSIPIRGDYRAFTRRKWDLKKYVAK